jgi:hypothetical protein
MEAFTAPGHNERVESDCLQRYEYAMVRRPMYQRRTRVLVATLIPPMDKVTPTKPSVTAEQNQAFDSSSLCMVHQPPI